MLSQKSDNKDKKIGFSFNEGDIHIFRGGWVYLYSFICSSAGAVEWESSCFATTLLHHAPPKVTLVLVLFVIFGGLF